jgi:hypothetical protein
VVALLGFAVAAVVNFAFDPVASDDAAPTTVRVTKTLTPMGTPADLDASFGDGTYRVGIDILSGRYRTVVPVGPGCYWSRLRSFSGKPDSIIRERTKPPGSALILTVEPMDAGITSQDCGVWRQ